MNIVSKRKIWLSISGILVLASVLSVVVFGLNFGIDFTGGSLMELSMEEQVNISEVRTMLEGLDYGEVLVQSTGDAGLIIRMPFLGEEDHQVILSLISESFGSYDELRFDSFGPIIGEELRKKSLYAIGFVFIAIILYVAWAFRKVSRFISSWKQGVITVIAALHDVIIPIGVFAILGRVFGIEVDTAFVAGLLTIMGYSVNDTIVVFDRVRENLLQGDDNFVDTVNKSIRQTLARSINTTLTTLLALLAIFLLGGDTTKMFTLTLIIGIGIGAYSSIFLASPLLVVWEKGFKKKL